MQSASGRYVVVYNGEIYNHRSLRAELDGANSGAWRGHSDTEVLLRAFEIWGIEASLPRLVGMFAIAVWDRLTRELTLVRDRAGEKPLYWGWLSNRLVFASELKAFEALPNYELRQNAHALPLLLRFGYIPAPYSIYENVEKLSAGTWMRFAAPGAPSARGVFWSATESAAKGATDPLELTATQSVDELERLLTDSVKLQLEADVPVGAFLSGGIDSSTVVALAQKCLTSKVRTFSIGFEEQAFDESAHARRVAQHLGTDHTEMTVTASDCLDTVAQMPDIYDEPFADSSQIPTYLVAKLARGAVSVSLSGDGGDELFAGYPRYGRVRSLAKIFRTVPAIPRRALAALIEQVPARTWTRMANAAHVGGSTAAGARSAGDRLFRVAQMLRVDVNQLYRYLACATPDLGTLLPGVRAAATAFDEPSTWPSLPSEMETFMWLDFMTYLPDNILVKLDRASMAVGLESRVPILDHRVIEFSQRVPLSLKVRDGVTKWILRQVLYRHVPREIVDRPKMGFTMPVSIWLRGPLREWAEALLFPSNPGDEVINSAELRRLWLEHQSGERDWQHLFWSILMLRGWEQRRKDVVLVA